MGRVLFLIDPDALSIHKVDIEVSKLSNIFDLRKQIKEHLKYSDNSILCLRMKNVFFERFKDWEGFSDVQVNRVSARGELVSVLHSDQELPSWCTDELICYFKLLTKVSITEAFESAEFRIIDTIAPNYLASTNLDELLFSILPVGRFTVLLLDSEIFNKHLEEVICNQNLSNVSRSEIIIFLRKIFSCENPTSKIKSLYKDVFLEVVRRLVSKYQLKVFLPALSFDESIINSLSFSKPWWDEVDVENILLPLTKQLLTKINNGGSDPQSLSEVIFCYSPTQLELIESKLKEDPRFATSELLQAIERLEGVNTSIIRKLIQEDLEEAPPPPLNQDATAKKAMEWANLYLNYIRSSFKHGGEPSQSLSSSFSNWANNQQSRLQNEDYYWVAVSNAVKDSLRHSNRVILIVVDALGSVVSNVLEERLVKNFSNEHNISVRHLFAPLPTLTEVGKLAVTTGINVYKIPVDQEDAIWRAYKDVLSSRNDMQVLKSWVVEDRFINDETKLLVYFENQFDEKLHDCITYTDLQSQLDIVCEKVSMYVSNNFQSPTGKTEIFITADHGLTKIAKIKNNIGWEGGKVYDRCIKVRNNYLPIPLDFMEISPEGAPTDIKYLICSNRERLINKPAPFVHGGLTAEEVLIPFIKISSKSLLESDKELSVVLLSDNAIRTEYGWQVNLEITAKNSEILNFSLEALHPFVASYNHTNLSILNSKIEIKLNITSTIPQSGNVIFNLEVKYITNRSRVYETICFPLNIHFPEMLFIKSKDAQEFDSMFDK